MNDALTEAIISDNTTKRMEHMANMSKKLEDFLVILRKLDNKAGIITDKGNEYIVMFGDYKVSYLDLFGCYYIGTSGVELCCARNEKDVYAIFERMYFPMKEMRK